MSEDAITIDYAKVLVVLSRNRWLLLGLNGAMLLLIILIVLLRSPWYSSRALISPDTSRRDQLSEVAMKLPAIAGGLAATLGGAQSNSERFVEVLQSDPIITAVLEQNYEADGDSVSLYDVLGVRVDETDRLFEEKRIDRGIRVVHKTGALKAMVSRETGSIVVESRVPEYQTVPAQVVEEAISRLEVHFRDVNRTAAGEMRKFLEGRAQEATNELRRREDDVVQFELKNDEWKQSAPLRSEHDRLAREKRRLELLYLEIAQQLELVRLQELATAPIFTVVSPPRIDGRRVSPNYLVYFLIGLSLSLSLSIGGVFTWEFLRGNAAGLRELLDDGR